MTPRTTCSPTSRPRAALAAAGAVGLALALAACSSSSSAPSEEVPADATEQAAAPAGAPQDGWGGAPGVSGEVAAVDDGTAQVQDGESQTAVSWSQDTTITVVVDGSLADVTVGSCIVATVGATSGDGTEGSTARNVAVSEPVDGDCSAGSPRGAAPGGEPGGEPGGDAESPDGGPTALPSEPPDRSDDSTSDQPPGAPEGGVGQGVGLVTGSVTAVDGSTITVSVSSPEEGPAEQTVTIDGATTYTVQRAGTSADVVVGQCVTAQGDRDVRGGLDATSLSLSAPGDEGCTSVRGGFPGGGQGADGDA